MHVGLRRIQVRDDGKDLVFPVLLLYPTEAPPAPLAFGPYTLHAAEDAPPAPGCFPLIAFSHGGGSTPLAYRALAARLAARGFAVAMPTHPGDNRDDRSRQDTDANVEDRPRHLGLALDAALADPRLRDHLRADAVAAVGHSMGAYTALAAAGAVPWTRAGRRVPVTPDPRIRALVLMAPAAAFFAAPGALAAVDQPILLLAAERDALTPPALAERVRNGVPDPSRVDLRVVPNAGHHSFLSPFPPALRRPGFLPAEDPEGFDREAFQDQLLEAVAGFLEAQLRA